MLPTNDEVSANVEQPSDDSTKPAYRYSSKLSVDDLLKLTSDDSSHGSNTKMGPDQPPKALTQSTVSIVEQANTAKVSLIEETQHLCSPNRSPSAVSSTNSPLKEQQQQPSEHAELPRPQPGAYHCNPGFRTQRDDSESASDDQLDSSEGTKRPPLEGATEVIPSFRGLEAELVDTHKEMERMEKELLRNLQNEAAVAEVVVKTPPNKFRRYCTIISVSVASLVAGVSVAKSSRDSSAPTMPPTLPPEERISQMVAFLKNVTFSNSTNLKYPLDDDDDSTPEARALAWMIDDDPLRLTVHDDRDRFLQRYTLTCLWMSNPDSLLSSDWLRKESECDWEGVDCDDSGNVVDLTLPQKQLVKLPDDLGFLSHVRVIQLEENYIKGTIPSSIALMKDLSSFEIFDNELTGMVPWESFSEMSNIEKFSISLNKLSGTLPSAMANWWPNMTGFSVWSNSMIEGTIPAELGSWSLLKHFLVDQTNVHGTLPDSIGMWTNLILVYAGQTAIHGTLPSTIAAWSNLEEFNVQHSGLGGTIPEAIGDTWRNMAYFELNSNSFSGTLPSGMSQWSNIKEALLQDNNFTGTMPLCDLDKVIDVLIADCEDLNCTCCTYCPVTRLL